MATGLRGASSIINKLQYSPIKQLEMQQAQGRDNRAISQEDRMLGKQVADEQSKMVASEQKGQELSMRKDKLSFAKKVETQRQSMREEKLKMDQDAFSHNKLFQGLEAGIGLAATGVGYFRRKQEKKLAAEVRKGNQEHQDFMRRHIGMHKGSLGSLSPYDVDYG